MKYEILKNQRLRDLRTDKDISQKTIAEYLKIRQTTYSKYELGERNITLETMSLLADYFETSVDYLIGRTDIKKPYPKSKNYLINK